jgi:hypothetical protein
MVNRYCCKLVMSRVKKCDEFVNFKKMLTQSLNCSGKIVDGRWSVSRSWQRVHLHFSSNSSSPLFRQRVMEPQNLDGAIRRNQLEWDKKSNAHFDEEIKQMFDSYSLTYLAFPARNQSDLCLSPRTASTISELFRGCWKCNTKFIKWLMNKSYWYNNHICWLLAIFYGNLAEINSFALHKWSLFRKYINQNNENQN